MVQCYLPLPPTANITNILVVAFRQYLIIIEVDTRPEAVATVVFSDNLAVGMICENTPTRSSISGFGPDAILASAAAGAKL